MVSEINSLLKSNGLMSSEDCGIGTLYYNFLEQSFILGTGKWLNNDM